MGALQPCLDFSPGRWARRSLLCTPLPKLGEGRGPKHLKSEGKQVGRKKGAG